MLEANCAFRGQQSEHQGLFSSHPSFLHPKMDLGLNSSQSLPQRYNSFTISLSKEKPTNAPMRNVQKCSWGSKLGIRRQ